MNLGIGLPTEVANFIPLGVSVMLHSENGLLGMGPFPTDERGRPAADQRRQADGDRAARREHFDSALSFAMIRGGHVDLAILGGLEVACNGDLANWTVPGKLITGMGGAMDLAAGATPRRRAAEPRLQGRQAQAGRAADAARRPRSAASNRVITELGVFDTAGDHFICVERADGVSQETIETRDRRAGPVHDDHRRRRLR